MLRRNVFIRRGKDGRADVMGYSGFDKTQVNLGLKDRVFIWNNTASKMYKATVEHRNEQELIVKIDGVSITHRMVKEHRNRYYYRKNGLVLSSDGNAFDRV